MSLLDNLTNGLKNGWSIAKEKGELGARIGRLRLEMMSLVRERESQFARLGRAYHANATDLAGLQPLILEIDRLTQTLRDRESVLAQLSTPEVMTEPVLYSHQDLTAEKQS